MPLALEKGTIFCFKYEKEGLIDSKQIYNTFEYEKGFTQKDVVFFL